MLGILLYYIIDHYFVLKNKIIVLCLMMLFSVLADIDLHSSYIGKKIKVFSFIFEVVLGHRGIMHSLWIAMLFFIILYINGYGIIIISFVSHLTLDMLNKKGICLFWPFLKIKGWFISGHLFDNILFYSLFTLDLLITSLKFIHL
jgi:membrane-bound metal-dependent hydrolase YbcI (DUF457 family)